MNPSLVSRLSIRSQADLHEALRIKQTTERQEQHIYAPPAPGLLQQQSAFDELDEADKIRGLDEPRGEEGGRPSSPTGSVFGPPQSIASIDTNFTNPDRIRATSLREFQKKKALQQLGAEESEGRAPDDPFMPMMPLSSLNRKPPPPPPGAPKKKPTVKQLREQVKARGGKLSEKGRYFNKAELEQILEEPDV